MLALLFAATVQTDVQRVPLQDNPTFGDLGKYWIEEMPKYGVTGFAVVAIKDGRVVLLDAYGDADPFAGKKADIDTRYYIASITKTMTATAIVQLAEQRKLDLDSPVQKYLPRFDLADQEFAKTVTVRDLLCHKPGIGGGNVVQLDAYTGGITEDRYYRMLAASTPTKQVQYTNTHFTILGRVIEAVSGEKWQDYLAKNVFAKAGMSRTTAYMSDLRTDTNFAPPAVVGHNGPAPAPFMKTDRTMHAAGGVLTTVRDMARYMLAWMGGGEQLISNQATAEAFKHQSSFPTDGSIRKMSGYGYAWNVGDYRDQKGFASHGGGYTGYQAYVAMVPGQKSGVAVFVNLSGPGGGFMTVVAVDALDRLFGYKIDTGVRSAYEQQANSFMQGLKTFRPAAPNPALSGLLSLPVERYVGRFENELYGEIELRYSGGYLKADFGDLPMSLRSTKLDEFSMHESERSDGAPCRFVVAAGACTAIEMDIDGTWLRFDRR
ncbi:MAG: serine hydrolase [Fimbriimonadaceae bacterium]